MVAFRQAQGLAKLGHKVVVFTPRIKDSKTVILNSSFVIRFLFPFVRFRNAAFVPQLLFYLRKGKFDVVHLHYPFFGGAEIVWLFSQIANPPAGGAGRKSQIAITYHHDVVGEGILKKIFALHTRYILPRILKKAHAILVSSLDYARHSAISTLTRTLSPQGRGQGKGVPLIELPFGINTKIFTPMPRDATLCAQYHLAPTDRVVMFLGGLDRAHYFKGVDVLLNAFARLRNSYKLKAISYKLLIVGDGDLRSQYERLARGLGVANQVIFAGYIPEPDKIKYFNLADVLALPSIDKSEAFGIVLLEAMACAKPVVASSLPGIRSLVKHGESGYLVKPKENNDLAQKITMLLSNDELRKLFGSAGRKRVEDFYNEEKIIKKLEEIYQEIRSL